MVCCTEGCCIRQPGMAPYAFPPHMPHGGMSPGGKDMPPGFEGMPSGGYPMGIMLNLQPPPPSMPPPNKPALWEKIQDSRRHPVTIGSMPVGCPHGKSRRPLPAIGSASSMSDRMLITAGTRRRTNLATTSRLRRRRRRCRQRRSHPLQCQGRPETLDFRNVIL